MSCFQCFLKCFGAKMGMFESAERDTFEINEEFIHTYLDDIIVDKNMVAMIEAYKLNVIFNPILSDSSDC